MKSLIKGKLNIVDNYYPKHRLDKSKVRWERIWKGEPQMDRYPFVFAPLLYLPYDDIHTAEERINITLDDLISRGSFQDDIIPSIFPGCLQTTLPNMLGAKEVILGKEHVAEKIIKSPEDVDNLTVNMGKGTIAHNWLEMQKRIIELTDGRIPVHVCDMQGPFDSAAQICGYDNLIFMAYEDKKRYDRLMSLMCEAFCSFWEAQHEVIGDLFIGTHLFAWDYLPPVKAITMSVDSLVMMSPDFFNEFVIPYLKIIYDRLGKLIIHSCGYFSHIMPVLMEQEIIMGINPAQMTLGQVEDPGFNSGKVLITATNRVDLPEVIKKCKTMGYNASISAYVPCPLNKEGNPILNYNEWNDSDKEGFIQLQQKILETAKV